MDLPGKLNIGALRARFDRSRGMAELAADLALALGVLLLIGMVFMAWQAWLIARQAQAAQDLVQAKAQALQQVGAEIALQQKKVDRTLGDPALRAALAQGDAAGRGRAAQLARGLLPDLHDAVFYSAGLDEALNVNIQQFGVANATAHELAARLLHVQSGDPSARVEVHAHPPQMISFVQAVVDQQGNTLAYAAVEMPFAPVRAAFAAADLGPGRLDLRQGDGSGDLVLDSRGDRGVSTENDRGAAVAGTPLRIAGAPPEYWLPVTQSFGTAIALAVLALLIACGLLWARFRIRAREVVTAEPVLADIVPPAPLPAIKPAPQPAAVAKRAATPSAIDRGIFRAYDIRGVVGKTLTEDSARAIGRAIGSVMRDKNLPEIAVGRDGRLSGPQMSDALIEGLRAAGIDVIDIGLAPTPVVYFASFHLNTGSCVAVTGSHNPPDYNGFKIVIDGQTLAEDAIQDLYTRIVENRLAEGRGTLRPLDVSADYIARIASDIQPGRSLKVVVDCGSGIAGAIAPEVIHAIGCEAIPLYCEVDGNFPHHHPDPSEPANLADLILMVKKTGADLGLAFDGDGDRLGVVSKEGEIIYPDRLLMLFAMDVLIRNPGATIIYDVKCTGHLQPLILKAGGSPLMWKTGHSLIKAKMRETGAQLAGEMSGHFFFRERWYGFDDGIYSAARLLEILADDPADRTPEQIFSTLPKGVSTPELHATVKEGENHAFIERFREHAQFEGARITTIDGLRADWPDGWGLVRASNTTPVLVLRFDADNADALKRIQEIFRAQLLSVDSSLQLPF
ncbi:MAG: phosphomannomutase/phosphoglucomutase [Rhodanobacteraceae bacterium]